MKIFLISDNTETYEGLRMAGVSGIVAHTGEAVMQALTDAASGGDIAIVAITEKAYSLAKEKVDRFMSLHSRPIITRIPDRHGSEDAGDGMSDFIRSGIGLNI